MNATDNFKSPILESSNKNQNENFDILDFYEVISEFLIRKIHFSIVSKSFGELKKLIKEKKELITASCLQSPEPDYINCDNEIEFFYSNFFENLISFIKKCLENLKEFFNFCFSTKSTEDDEHFGATLGNSDILHEKNYNILVSNYCIYALEKINSYLIQVLTEERNFTYFTNKSNIIAFQFLKGFLEFEKNFKKKNQAKNYQMRFSISDVFISNEKCFGKLQELISIQKNFCSNYFQSNISSVFLECLEKENSTNLFKENTLFEKLKTILKDNFLFLNAFEKSPEIFSITYEENYKFFVKELLNFLRSIYNRQVSYFSAARKINKLNILYLIDFSIKFLCFKNKLIQKVKKINWLQENKNKFFDYSAEAHKGSNLNLNQIAINSISLLNNKISRINDDDNYLEATNASNGLFYEGLQILNNLCLIILL